MQYIQSSEVIQLFSKIILKNKMRFEYDAWPHSTHFLVTGRTDSPARDSCHCLTDAAIMVRSNKQSNVLVVPLCFLGNINLHIMQYFKYTHNSTCIFLHSLRMCL